MNLRAAPIPGLRIAGCASVAPSELAGNGAPDASTLESLDNAQACRAIWGESWQQVLAQIGWAPDHVAATWGVQRRCWTAVPGRPASAHAPDAGDLALAAARAALRDASREPDDVDLLVVATSTPPRATSSLAARLARELGCRGAAFDVRAGGAGALDAWLVGASLLAQGAHSALIVASETPSRWLDARVPALALLYGDGAGAVLLERDERDAPAHGGLLGGLSLSVAGAGRPMTVPGPLPPTPEALVAGQYRMEAPDRDYVRALAAARRQLLTGLRAAFPADVAALDHFLPAAVTAPQALEDAGSLGMSPDRLATSLREHGALGCAAPLVALAALGTAGRLKPGVTVGMSAVGGGICATALLWRC